VKIELLFKKFDVNGD